MPYQVIPCLKITPSKNCYFIYKSRCLISDPPLFRERREAECDGWHCGADVGNEVSTKKRENTGRGGWRCWRQTCLCVEGQSFHCSRQMNADPGLSSAYMCLGGSTAISSVPNLRTTVHDLWQLHYEAAFSPLEMLIYESQKLPLSSMRSSCGIVGKVLESQDTVWVLALLFHKAWGKILISWWLNYLICEVNIIISTLPIISQSCKER